MGCCQGGDATTRDLDARLKSEQSGYKKLIRILLLGPGDSGKTTIVKQMKKIHHGNIEKEELLNFRSLIRKQILDTMSLLSKESQSRSQKFDESVEEMRDKLAEEIPLEELDLIEDVTPIKLLWKDKQIQKLTETILIAENADYFLEKVEKITDDNYIPTFEDYIRCRVKTTGHNAETFETICNNEKVPLEIIDVGGQRAERRKWMHLFQDEIDAVLYVFGLGGYDKVLYEDCNVNRLHEALDLFEQVKKIGFLEKKTVILFFNKFDIFLDKIKSVPITVALDDYPKDLDPNNEEHVVEDVLRRFEDIYKREYHTDPRTKEVTLVNDHKDDQVDSKSFFMHQTTALDTDLIKRLMASIQLALVMKNVGYTGVI